MKFAMAKQGEIDFLRNCGAFDYAAGKPFSDPECGRYLLEMGALLYLLPPPPARLLDLGCGTGWTSCLLARRGYDVVGQDIAPDMIHQAGLNKQRYGVGNVQFVTCDYENLSYDNEFDCVVFYDSLHHAMSEELALSMAYRALRPGGVCVISEPGWGHARREHSLAAVRAFNVTEKDMPPRYVIRLGKNVGFRSGRAYPHMKPYGALLYGVRPGNSFYRLSRLPSFLRSLALAFYQLVYKRFDGITLLIK
jgi:ubiquinone/menaquinone biosynthesis C-methylase UbiE